MSNFNYQDELKRLIKNKELIEVDIRDDDERRTSYLFSINDEYLVFARVTNDATLGGVTICLTRDLGAIQTETRFCKALAANIKGNSLYDEALQYIQQVRQMNFRGFISAFKGSRTLLDIQTIEGSFAGRVIDFDDDILVLDEYYVEEGLKASRTYLNQSSITSITVGSSWLKVVSSALPD